jgi:arginine exporter protein ArgO
VEAAMKRGGLWWFAAALLCVSCLWFQWNGVGLVTIAEADMTLNQAVYEIWSCVCVVGLWILLAMPVDGGGDR